MFGSKEVLGRLGRWSPIGHRVLENGAHLIGRVPHVAPEAWLHYIFAPAKKTDVSELSQKIQIHSKFDYFMTLQMFNGLDLFSSNFYLYGVRFSNDRAGIGAEPWDLVVHHREAIGMGAPIDCLVIGGGRRNLDRLTYIQSEDGRIFGLKNSNFMVVIDEWIDLRSLIFSETERLGALFDNTGRPISRNQE